MQNLKIYPLTKDTINLFKNCFDINESPKKIENIEWQFLQNTPQKCFVNIAFDEKMKKTAAIYATSCVQFKVENEIYIGTQSLDTITDIDYRGQGLFTKLAKGIFQNAEKEEIVLVYGFPNGNSIHGFKKHLDWEVLDPVPFLIKPLKTKYFTNKINVLRFLPNINLSYSKFKKNKNFSIFEKKSFPKEVNIIWERFSNKFNVAVVRNEEYLNWRYLKKPNEDYHIAHCYNVDNKYIGFIVFAIKEKHNGKIGYIMELIYDPSYPKASDLLLNFAIASIKKHKADCVLAWCFKHSPNFKSFKKSLFIKMPEKIRPIELHFGVRSFKPNLNKLVYGRKNWYISYSDSDTV